MCVCVLEGWGGSARGQIQEQVIVSTVISDHCLWDCVCVCGGESNGALPPRAAPQISVGSKDAVEHERSLQNQRSGGTFLLRHLPQKL